MHLRKKGRERFEMAEKMQDDDDMIVLVIEDEDIPGEDSQNVPISYPVVIKKEVEDSISTSGVDEILHTAQEHGEYINIKQEKQDYDIEFLEQEIPIEFVQVDQLGDDSIDPDAEDKGYIPKDYDDASNCGLKRKVMKGQYSLQKSYVQKLRIENPEMKEDPTLIVEHLTNIMRELQPPTPPKNFCIVIYENDAKHYKCTTCEAVNPTAASASRHYQNKHGKKYMACFACGVKYRGTTNLYRHEKRCKHPDAKIVLKARGCYLGRKGRGRPFLTKNKFAPRVPPVQSAKERRGRLYCTKCPASFVHRENLEAHENTHAGLRPYRCDACPAAYTSDTGLKRHLRTHGENQFICDDCGREFKLKPLLVSHLNTHRPYRKYPCDKCDRRFAQKTALRHHINIKHLNLPPAHGCPVCPKRYARISHVKDHMKRVHGLAMITRKMFYKALPTMTDIAIKEAAIVLNTEVYQLFQQNPPKVIPPKPETVKTKKKINHTLTDNTIDVAYEIIQNVSEQNNEDEKDYTLTDKTKDVAYQIIQHVSEPKNEDEVYEIVPDKDEEKLLEYEIIHRSTKKYEEEDYLILPDKQEAKKKHIEYQIYQRTNKDTDDYEIVVDKVKDKTKLIKYEDTQNSTTTGEDTDDEMMPDKEDGTVNDFLKYVQLRVEPSKESKKQNNVITEVASKNESKVESTKVEVHPAKRVKRDLRPVKSVTIEQSVKSAKVELGPVKSAKDVRLLKSTKIEQPVTRAYLELEPLKSAKVEVQPVKSAKLVMQPLKSAKVDVRAVKSAKVAVQPVKSSKLMQPLKNAKVDVRPVKSVKVAVQPVKSAKLEMQHLKSAKVDVRAVKSAKMGSLQKGQQ